MIEIRELMAADAADIAGLSGELGYPCTAEEMRERIGALSNAADHALFVACTGGRVVAWIDVAIVQHLASAAFGEIGGLIVSEELRGRKIGEQLVRRAEEWVASRGVRKIVVRSRVMRERAHEFYLRNGYREWKRQVVFEKEL